jgi:uncharacterized protein (TIGR02145 family)
MRKSKSLSNFTIAFIFIIFLFLSCKEEANDINKPPTAKIPTLTTATVTDISTDRANCNGTITSDGGAKVISQGVCWSTSIAPTINDNKNFDIYSSNETISGHMNELIQNTTYYVRAFATNSVGTGYGNQVSFKTNAALLPVVTLEGNLYSSSNVTITTVKFEMNITSDGGATVTESGICYSTQPTPKLSDLVYKESKLTGISYPTIEGLTPNTKYYFRAYATNSIGTAYSGELSFTTLDGCVGNSGIEYKTVTIGTQTWLAKNLCETTFQNGDLLSVAASSNYYWNTTTTAAAVNYFYYDTYNQIHFLSTTPYGYLYNWYAITDNRKIAPKGWHVATKNDWETLINYLGGESVAGGKLKERGNTNWGLPNYGATNESGFTAVPGGCRRPEGNCNYWGSIGFYWSSTENGNNAYSLSLSENYRDATIDNNHSKNYGMSVRCVKD